MVLWLVSFAVLAAWYLLVSRLERGSLSSRLVLAATGASGQVVLTLLLLGLAGGLTQIAAVLVNLAIAAGAIAGAILVANRRRIATIPATVPALLASDGRSILGALRAAAGWETVLVGAGVLFASAWIALAIVHYPPRGVDDLVYHLPPLYKAVQDGHISLLPLELRSFFAFPMDADLPALWVMLLTGGVGIVDATQALFALFAALAVYALARELGASARSAAFAAGLFLLLPVMLLQVTTNYVDVTTNAWLLAGVVALLRCAGSGGRLPLAIGGLAAGLVLGSKYQMVVPVAVLVALGWFALRRGARGPLAWSGMVYFWAPLLAGSAFWYIRNWVRFGNPFYPLPVRLLGATIFDGPWAQGASIWSQLLEDPGLLGRIAIWDPGFGTDNGGFGFLFWGCAIPASLYLGWELLRSGDPLRGAKLMALGLVPAGFAGLFISPIDDLHLTPRYVLCVAAPVFIAVALLAERAVGRIVGGAGLLRAAGVLAAWVGMVGIAGSEFPTVNLRAAAEAPASTRGLTEMRFLGGAYRNFRTLGPCWAALDAMTDPDAGLSVYQASVWTVFWTGPTFGTHLQNRVWNLDSAPSGEPNAWFFHGREGRLFYLGRTIERGAIAGSTDNLLVASGREGRTTLYVSRSALKEKGRLGRLGDYYRRTIPDAVSSIEPLAGRFREGSVVLPEFPLAGAFLALKAEGRMGAEVDPLTSQDLESAAGRWPDRDLWTIGTPIPGRRTVVVGTLTLGDLSAPLYRHDAAAESAGGTR